MNFNAEAFQVAHVCFTTIFQKLRELLAFLQGVSKTSTVVFGTRCQDMRLSKWGWRWAAKRKVVEHREKERHAEKTTTMKVRERETCQKKWIEGSAATCVVKSWSVCLVLISSPWQHWQPKEKLESKRVVGKGLDKKRFGNVKMRRG